MARICLTCNKHGPPLSHKAGHGHCEHCIANAGAPDWAPVSEPTGYESPEGETNETTAEV